MYTFPDGSTQPHPPSDGQVFFQYDSNGKVTDSWQYDAFVGQWFSLTSWKPVNNNGQRAYNPGYHNHSMPTSAAKEEKKCKCGSDSVGAHRHSWYCDKHTI